MRTKNDQAKSLFKILTDLPLFRNPYLNMQAQNIGIVDDLLVQMEVELWREYIDTEKTPFPAIMVVSALSQMWIFALYELLRTWKQMVNDLIRYHEQFEVIRSDPQFEEKKKQILGAKKKKVERSSISENMENIFYNEGFRKVENDPSYAILLKGTLDIVKPHR